MSDTSGVLAHPNFRPRMTLLTVMKRRVLCTKPTPVLEKIGKIPNESLSEGIESEPNVREKGKGNSFVRRWHADFVLTVNDRLDDSKITRYL